MYLRIIEIFAEFTLKTVWYLKTDTDSESLREQSREFHIFTVLSQVLWPVAVLKRGMFSF